MLSGAIPSQHVGTFNPENEDPVAAAAIGGGGVALFVIIMICMCVWPIIICKCCNQTATPSVTQTSQGNYTVDGVRVHHYPASEGITYTPRAVRLLDLVLAHINELFLIMSVFEHKSEISNDLAGEVVVEIATLVYFSTCYVY